MSPISDSDPMFEIFTGYVIVNPVGRTDLQGGALWDRK